MSYLLKPSFILRYEKDCLVLKIHKREKIYYVFYLKKKSNSKMQINPKLHCFTTEGEAVCGAEYFL